MRIAKIVGIAAAFLSPALVAQQPVAPTPDTVGRVRGEDAGGYNFVESFETGYRFRTAGGDIDRYRSDVNYGNGIRLLGSSLSIHSKEGHGKYFDELTLTTQGLGNDPYESASLRVQLNRWYKYDLLWRQNDYVNPGLTFGTLGGHALNTTRQMQDHDFTLFPQSKFRLFGGYSRNTQEGVGLTSINLFDSQRGDDFALFAKINRKQWEARVGGEAQFFGFKFNALHGWQHYEESTPVSLTTPSAGANPNDRTTLQSLSRTEPYSGDSPFWRLNLSNEKREWYAVNARFSYSGGQRGFTFDEMSAGTNFRGLALARQVLIEGTGRRPVSSGSLTFSLFPSHRWTIANHTGFSQITMDGNSSYSEFNNATQSLALLYFEYLNVRTIVNQTDVSYKAAKWLNFYGGYHYSVRRIRSQEGSAPDALTPPDITAAEQTNHLHTGVFGVRLQPLKPLSISLEGEIGRADQPFLPLSEKNYHAINGRIQYRLKKITLSAASKTNYNTNSVSLFAYSSQARNYSADVSWTPNSWFAVDAGYTKQHLNTLGGIAYFAAGQPINGDSSYYVSNLHAGNLGMRFNIRKRADLYVGYSRVQDTGGASRPVASLAAFIAVQSYPLAYDSPQARFSLRLSNKIRWNLGYQFYRYREDLLAYQDYRAHTGYTSVLWSF